MYAYNVTQRDGFCQVQTNGKYVTVRHVNYRHNRDSGYVLTNEASYDTNNRLLQRELNDFQP